MFSIEGSIPPRRIPFAYRLALALSAATMVLLPLVYGALICAAAYGVYLWVIFGTFVFDGGSGGLMRLVIYFAPIFAGGTLVLFMVKPLFARRRKRAEPYTLDLSRHPALHDLIATVCAKVRAPMPVRVDLDCQVNASAHLRRGLLSLGRKDLVLTIGLPLVHGLSARQLAGVLAHEFGHFAQGAGMALTFVIRSINAWFARVVFERDQWDATLASWTDQGDFRVRLIVALAQGGVWLSRQVLHGLMIVGHAITCLQLRQMEYDADYYEIQLAGSEEFIATAQELVRLGTAANVAFHELGELWRTRQLVDDFPGFVAAKRARFDETFLAKIDQQGREGKTGWLDTHPSNRDRDSAARRLALPGILRSEASARALFVEYDELARTATRHFYQQELGLAVDESAFVSTENAQRAGSAASASDVARERLVGRVLDLTRPILWRQSDFTPADGAAAGEIGGTLRAKRAEIDRLRPPAEADVTTYGNILEHLLLSEQAHALLSAGVKVTPKTFLLAKSELSDAVARRTELTRRRAAKVSELKPFDDAVHDWVALVGQAARARFPDYTLPSDLQGELVSLTTSLAALTPWFEAFPEWNRQHTVLSVFFANQKKLASDAKFMAAFKTHFEQAAALGNGAPALVGDAPFPLPTATGTTSAASLLRHAFEGVEGAARLTVALDTVANAYFRILSRSIALGEQLEKDLSAAGADRSPLASPASDAA